MSKKAKIGTGIAIAIAVAAMIAGMITLYFVFTPKAQEGMKHVTIEVVDDKKVSKKYEVNTDAEYVTGALDDAKEQGLTYEGETGAYGLTIYTVNGVEANYNTGSAYWAFYINDEYANYGPDQQPIADGDEVKFEYTVWTDAA